MTICFPAISQAWAANASLSLRTPRTKDVGTSCAADLDLSNPVGVRQLEARLTLAINDACGAAADVDLAGRNSVRACRQEARAQVVAERDRLLVARNPGASQVASAR